MLRTWSRSRAWLVALVGSLIALLALVGWYETWGPGALKRMEREAIAQGQEYLKQGRPARALRVVADIPEGGPSGAGVLAVKGMALALLDRPEEAREPLEASLARDPAQPMVAKVLAAVCFSRSELARGLELLETAARLDPGDFRPWHGAGDMYRRLNRASDAARAFDEALKRKPDHHESRVGRIWALLALGSTDAVGPELERALQDRPEDPEVHVLAARQNLALGQVETAWNHIETALSLDPNHVEALVLRAREHRVAGRLEDAMRDAERAVELAPQDASALYLLSLVQAGLGLDDEAAETSARHRALNQLLEQMNQVEREIEASPGDAQLRCRLADLAAEAGLTEFAIRNYQAALSLDPNHANASRGLATLKNE